MMTGHTDRKHVIEARDAGVNEFIAKPLTAKALIDRMRSVINNDRHWVKCSSFTGPDRRRRKNDSYAGPFRRATDQSVSF